MSMENDTFNPDSTVVGPVTSGAEQCEDIDKWVIGGATPGVGYEVGNWYGSKNFAQVPGVQTNYAQPFLTYATSGETVKYVCGIAIFPTFGK